jgi:hypothetical protein
LYWDTEVTPEDEDEIIRKIAERVHKYGMDVAAILMIESIKPLTYIGSQMGRFFVSPFLPAFGDEIGMSGEKFLQVFERRENVEKLLNLLEEMTKEEDRQKKEAKEAMKAEKASAIEAEETPRKKGWRRFLPF